MLLILLGLILIAAGLILRGIQLNPLRKFKTASGRLVGYEKNEATGEFHPLIAFSYITNKYFFKNTNAFKTPRQVLGSEQRVYFDLGQSVEVFGAPLLATLSYSSKNEYLPAILLTLGVACLWIFTQLTGLYLLFFLFIIAFRFVYKWAETSLYSADIFKDFIKENLERYPVSETFSEETLAKIKQIDLGALRLYRERWFSSEQSKGFALLVGGLMCLMLSAFATKPDIVEFAKAPVAKKALSIEQVLDAGSVEAAEDQFGEKIPLNICIWFESESCYYTYRVLHPLETSALIDRMLNLMIANSGVVLLFFALISLGARQIYAQHDAIEAKPKANA